MNTKDFVLLGAGYAAGRLSNRMSAGPIGGIKTIKNAESIQEIEKIIMKSPKSLRKAMFRQIPMKFTRKREYFILRNKI